MLKQTFLACGILMGLLSSADSACKFSPPNRSPEIQALRLATINAASVVQKHEGNGRDAYVWVRPAFNELDFDAKQELMSRIYAYYFDATKDLDMLFIRDSRNNNVLGTFSLLSCGLKLN